MTRAVAAFQQAKEASRRKILDGALRAFAAKGCDATMADVAGEARVSQGLAYRYFPSKEAIVSELVHEVTDSGGGFEGRVKKVQGTAVERLGLLLTNMLEGLRLKPEYPQFLNQVLRDESVPVELREAVANNFRAVKNTIRKLIVEAQASGDVAADDPDQLLAAVLAYVDGLLVRMTDPRRIESRRNFPDPKIVLRMLKPDADKRAG
jgi:AcrR family transcriptional regulator